MLRHRAKQALQLRHDIWPKYREDVRISLWGSRSSADRRPLKNQGSDNTTVFSRGQPTRCPDTIFRCRNHALAAPTSLALLGKGRSQTRDPDPVFRSGNGCRANSCSSIEIALLCTICYSKSPLAPQWCQHCNGNFYGRLAENAKIGRDSDLQNILVSDLQNF
ncbi:hypothetical protein ACLOJK_038665 [Asimina triloba]